MCLISYSVYRVKVKEMVLKLYPLKHLFFDIRIQFDLNCGCYLDLDATNGLFHVFF